MNDRENSHGTDGGVRHAPLPARTAPSRAARRTREEGQRQMGDERHHDQLPASRQFC